MRCVTRDLCHVTPAWHEARARGPGPGGNLHTQPRGQSPPPGGRARHRWGRWVCTSASSAGSWQSWPEWPALTVKCGIKMTNCPFKLLIDENWINLNIYNFKCHWAESLEISLSLCDWSPSSSLWCLSLVSLVLTSIITITARLRSLADMVLAPHGISGIRTL